MPQRRLSDEARQHLRLFEEKAGVGPKDCIVDEEFDRVILLVSPRDMADAIGPGGKTVRDVEELIGKDIKIVADAKTAEDFVANALAPAAVYDVTIETEDDQSVAYVDVDEQDIGAAIGTDGRNIEAARMLARRHFDIDSISVN